MDMFCSVQLNVNNPHFLIMQGRITKVLNMKPPEVSHIMIIQSLCNQFSVGLEFATFPFLCSSKILSMIEEAAGTRMYETKKQAAQKTIEKKDSKLRELDEVSITKSITA